MAITVSRAMTSPGRRARNPLGLRGFWGRGRFIRPRLSSRGGIARSPPASAISRPMVTTAGQRRPRSAQYRERSGWIFRLPKLGCASRSRRISASTAAGHSRFRVRCGRREPGTRPSVPDRR